MGRVGLSGGLSAGSAGLGVGRGSQEDKNHQGKRGERGSDQRIRATERPKETALAALSQVDETCLPHWRQ